MATINRPTPQCHHQNRVGRAVHRRLVGRIIANIVVIDDFARSETRRTHPADSSVNRAGCYKSSQRSDRQPVRPAPAFSGFARSADERLQETRRLLGNPRKHRRAPGVATKQPVAVRKHRRVIAHVAGHSFVEQNLRDERDHEIV